MAGARAAASLLGVLPSCASDIDDLPASESIEGSSREDSTQQELTVSLEPANSAWNANGLSAVLSSNAPAPGLYSKAMVGDVTGDSRADLVLVSTDSSAGFDIAVRAADSKGGFVPPSSRRSSVERRACGALRASAAPTSADRAGTRRRSRPARPARARGLRPGRGRRRAPGRTTSGS